MIVLDTNVVSELARKQPDEQVVTWLNSIPLAELACTVITQAELMYGIALLPRGKRKQEIEEKFMAFFCEILSQPVLSFDSKAAQHYAIISAQRRAVGKPINVLDAQIAAICLANEAVLATRNVKDFLDIGLLVHNPWQ
jgi:predicted nucleic acid-binding protein